MNESQISVRYAKALFRSASEKQILEQVYRDMDLLSETCNMKDFQYMLAVPVLQASQKSKLIHSIFEKYLSGISIAMIDLVIINKREIYLPGIARNFGDLYRQARGIRKASLVTARPVDKSAIQGIRELISRKFASDIELSSAVDKHVIGGFVLTVEDRQYDASVAANLEKIKKQLLQTSIEKR
jgi:F-type H+-transporting ATPase subunit delta